MLSYWKLVGWKKPEFDLGKKNSDGVSKGNPGLSGESEKVKDDAGCWLCCFMKNTRVSTFMTAKF